MSGLSFSGSGMQWEVLHFQGPPEMLMSLALGLRLKGEQKRGFVG